MRTKVAAAPPGGGRISRPATLEQVSNLPISSKYVSTPDKPVDAVERESVVARVNAAFEAGALDDLDYRRCLDLAFAAKTLGQLRPVVETLPPVASYDTPGNIERAPLEPGTLAPAGAPANRTLLIAGGSAAVAVLILLILLVILL